jgi:hypothetical protein
MHIKRALVIFLGIVISLNTSGILFAGQLDDFEKAATKKKSASSEKKENTQVQKNDDDSFLGDIIGDFFGEIFSVLFYESFKGMFLSIQYGGQLSLSRTQGASDHEYKDIVLRENGSPDLPFLRTDFNYHRVHSGIDGFDGRVEVGYGPFGLQYRNTHFSENSPQDDMTISYIHGLYRVSGSSAFEFDTGLGAMTLEGEDRNSGPSITFPINIYPHPNLNIRLVPTWSDIHGNGVGDYDGSVAYVHKYFSLRFGFQRIQTHDEVLQGPYAGFSIHY